MPELPEVELVVRHLSELIVGRTLVKSRLLRPGLAPENPPRQFAAWLRGARIERVARRGKHILAHLSNGRTWITHLRMTGRFLHLEQSEDDLPHTHAVFHLDNGRKLIFTDQRHFGMMMITRTDALDHVESLRKLAPEPFDAAFSDEYFHQSLKRSRQPIKLFLLDQTRVTGLGNIYASEALFRAGINPARPSNKLTPRRAAGLRKEIVDVLGEAIEAGSVLENDSREVAGRYGERSREDSWRVYDREGMPCLKCGAQIRRIVQGGRSTYYCPRCQRG